MADHGAVQDTAEYDRASRELLRRLADTSEQMAAAEPGTDDFLAAYVESCRLREMYNQVRGTWQAPADIWDELPGTPNAFAAGEASDREAAGREAADGAP